MNTNILYRAFVLVFLLMANTIVFAQSVLDATVTKVNPSVSSPFGGSVSINVTGGVSPYKIEWCGNNATDTVIRGLKAGEYNFKVIDSLDNELFFSEFLTLDLIWDSINIGFTENILYSNSDGTLSFEVDGDTSAMAVGFAKDTGSVDTVLNIAFYFAGGVYKILINDTLFDLPGFSNGYKAGDVFKMIKIQQRINFYKNGILVFERRINDNANVAGYRLGGERGETRNYGPISSIDNIHVTFGVPAHTCDNDKIWMLEKTYDEYGNVIAESKVFYDQIGRVIQTQVKNETENNVLVSENIYDRYGRLGISTLPAPINIQNLCYAEGFVTSLDGLYDHSAYDVNDYPKKLSSAASGSVFNPKPVFAGIEGTLGWFYSNNNYLEPYVATTSFPYSRVEYSNDPRSVAEKSTMPGDLHSLGKGHEKETYIVAGGNEMDFTYGRFTSYETEPSETDPFKFPYLLRDSKDGDNPIPVLKSVSFDENGKEVLNYTSTRGGVLASCVSGLEGGYCNSNSSGVLPGSPTGIITAAARLYYVHSGDYTDDPEIWKLNIDDKNAVDIHIAKAAKSQGIEVFVKAGYDGWQPALLDPAGINVSIVDLRTDKVLVQATDYSITNNIAGSKIKINLLGSELLSTSIYRVSVTLFRPDVRTLYNGDSINYPTDQIRYAEIRYGIDYSNWTINYYDKNTGQLLKNVAPKDFLCNYNIGEPKPDISYADSDPDNSPYNTYNQATHTFNISNNTVHPTIIPTAPIQPQYVREQEITVFLGQKYFPNSIFYSDQPTSAHQSLIPFVPSPYIPGLGFDNCDFIDHELRYFDDPFSSIINRTFNPATSIINSENFGTLLDVSTNSGNDDPRDDIHIPRSLDEITSAMFYDPEISGGSNGSGLPSSGGDPTPSNWCYYYETLLDMYKYPFHAEPYCQLAFGNQGIGDNYSYIMSSPTNLTGAYAKPYVMHEATARAVFNGCASYSSLYCNDNMPEPDAEYECDGLIKKLITFKLRVSVTANDANPNSSITKYTTVNASVMEGCCKLLWYEFEPVRVKFTEQELLNKLDFVTKIEGIRVEQSKEMVNYDELQGFDNEGNPIYSTYITNIDYDWNPYKWQFNNLLAWTDMTISSNTKYFPVAPMEHFTSQAYAYDNYGRVIGNYSQDEGKTEIKYSDANEVRYTQNALQRATNSFSYIDYDDYGRPKEIGEYTYQDGSAWGYFLSSLSLTAPKPEGATDVGSLFRNNNYISTTTPGRQEVINYFYDVPDAAFPDEYDEDYIQHFTDGVLSYVSYNGGDSKTWYSYDEFGRSEWGLRLIDGLGYKTADFRYGLLGNVLVSAYQKDNPNESYYEAYTYDRDMRLSKAYVSTTGTTNSNGEIDVNLSTATKLAEYKYYLHGPLKRVELGDKLQGIDYVYTVQGWLKSINTPNIGLAPNRDPGGDGRLLYTGGPLSVQKLNPANYKVDDSRTAYDVFGMTLDYFPGDYERKGTFVQTFNYPDGMEPYSGTAIDNPASLVDFNNFKPHYNGLVQAVRYSNISEVNQLCQQISRFHVGTINDPPADNKARMHFYEYDAMYQLTSSVYGSNPSIGNFNNTSGINNPLTGQLTFKPSAEYMEWGIKYDLNGNVHQLNRNGATGTSLYRDRLAFNYNTRSMPSTVSPNVTYTVNSNQLDRVTEAIGGQSSSQPELHGYAGGQNAANYEYDVLGRITKDVRKNILIEYNHLGKIKEVKNANTLFTRVSYLYDEGGDKIRKTEHNSLGAATRHTWYVGGVVYEDEVGDALPLAQAEIAVAGVGTWFMGVDEEGARIQGQIQFDIKDHLGNVRVSIINQRDSKGMPIVTGKYDYYSYGGLMPGRTLNPIGTQGHRQGYQGQEWDATLDMYSFNLRMYEPEFGRWLTADPMRQHHSPYMAMSNNPISFFDPDGGKDKTKEEKEREELEKLEEFWALERKYRNELINEAWRQQNLQQDFAYANAYKQQHFNMDAFAADKLLEIFSDYLYRDKNYNVYITQFKTKEVETGIYTLEDARKYEKNAIETDGSNPVIKGEGLYLLTIPVSTYLVHSIDYLNSSSQYWQPFQMANAENKSQDLEFKARYLIGPSLLFLSKDWRRLKPVAALGSKKGSSIASYTLSKMFPQTFTGTFGAKRGIVLKRVFSLGMKTSTNTIGRVMGRAVPVVGWAWTLVDVWQSDFAEAFRSGAQDHYRMNQEARKSGHSEYAITCFASGTYVSVSHKFKLIEKIVIGDSVKSYNIDSNRIEVGRVVNVLKRKSRKIYELITNNEKIYVTQEHPFYVKNIGWTKVKDLNAGCEFLTDEKETFETLLSVMITNKSLYVYNIEVDGNHNYFVTKSNILVHNKPILDLIIEKSNINND